ncbi:MAG: SigB/SigF/SigG family RNA polymerase sigma factor [Candidatus Eremiobacteraeota bacterium]|nr:SigB/SigF/SigG family RNA polymerase sigma factor [Candidatus Eremiobacteraeota bacterium]
MDPQPHVEEERWDRGRTREAFGRLAVARDRGGPDAERLRDELVVAHLNLVRYLAVKFANRGEALDDLIQVGTVGLIKAIDRFDLERGVEFTTYATPTIVGEIKRYFRDKGWAVKVPRRLQELNLSVNRAIEKLTVSLGHSPTVKELAGHLHASEEEILEAQELGQAYNLLSLDSEVTGDGDKNAQTLADYIGKADPGLANLEDRANLERAFEVLSRRERIILFLRFYESISQTEIAKRLNVSQMHVSRLQQKALEKLRDVLLEK